MCSSMAGLSESKGEVIELMNEAEKKLSEFSLLKTSSSHEAEESCGT